VPRGQPKHGDDPSPNNSPAPEVICFVTDKGSEQYRYDLTDLKNDNRMEPRPEAQNFRPREGLFAACDQTSIVPR